MSEVYVPPHLLKQKKELKKPLDFKKEIIDNTTVKTNSPYEIIESFEKIKVAKNLSYRTPTIIQKYAMSAILNNHPLLCRAPTGMGKTICFLLPLIENIKYAQGLKICIVCPTRELCDQIKSEAEIIVNKKLKVESIYGQSKYLKTYKGINIIVATPGRLLDLLSKNLLDVSTLDSFVLDEADRLLSMGFKDDIKHIKSYLPKEIECYLFSATYTRDLNEIIDDFLPPNKCVIEVENETVESIKQEFYLFSDENSKDLKLKELLNSFNLNTGWNKEKEADKILIFVAKKITTEEVASKLKSWKILVDVMNGDIDQSSRSTVLKRFRTGVSNILVATSLAARGIDIKNIKYVINYDFPSDIKEYIHRIGRTGRQGREGTSISFLNDSNLSPEMRKNLIDILTESKNEIPEFLLHKSFKKIENYKNDSERFIKKQRGRNTKRNEDFIKNKRSFDIKSEFEKVSVSSPKEEEKADSEEDLPGHW